jgi:DNA-binding transcriptional ArsR family regulator
MPATDVFAALANPVRRQILDLLRTGPRSAGEIAAAFELTRPTVSEHLQVLRHSGLVVETVQGRQHIYEVYAPALAEVREWLEPFERYWNERIDALDEVLRRNQQ